LEHVIFFIVIFFDVSVEGGVGEVSLVAWADVISALLVSSVSSFHVFSFEIIRSTIRL